MNARPGAMQHGDFLTAVGSVEHITIAGEPDPIEVPRAQRHRSTLQRYTLASRLHGSVTELSLLEGHHLGVRHVRPGTEPRRYQFDLRFASPTPVRARHIPWKWLLFASGLTVVGGSMLAAAWPKGGLTFGQGVIGGILATSIGIFALYVAIRRMTESVQFRSVHGNATLVSVTGGIGLTRRHTALLLEIAHGIKAARLQQMQDKRQFLCDEMREHHRLHRLGVLSDDEYEASKARILAAH